MTLGFNVETMFDRKFLHAYKFEMYVLNVYQL